MKKFALLSLVAAALHVVTTAASARQVQLEYLPSDLSTAWIGIAASPNGKAFQVANQSNEAVARSTAKFEMRAGEWPYLYGDRRSHIVGRRRDELCTSGSGGTSDNRRLRPKRGHRCCVQKSPRGGR